MTEFHSMVGKYLDDCLTEEEAARLAELLRTEPDKAAEFASLYEQHRLLAFLNVAPAAESVEKIMAQIAREEAPFVRAVLSGIGNPVAPSMSVAHDPSRIRLKFITPWFALAASVAALAIPFLWYFSAAVGSPVIAEVTGQATIERAGQAFPAQTGIALVPGDSLQIASTSTVSISFAPENTTLALFPSTKIRFISVAPGKRFYLAAGKIEASVARQRPFSPLLIQTPLAEARVVGTKLAVIVEPNRTELDVSEGKVRFTRTADRHRVEVSAHSFAIAAAGYEFAALPQTGSILREYWSKIPGSYYVTHLLTNSSFPNRPSGSELLAEFEAPRNSGENFGDRFRGYLIPPKTGDYTFWIAAADGGQLWLSRDSNPRNKTQIAFADHSAPRQWTKSASQQSATLHLVGGSVYYIEALRKCGLGENHLAVAWRPPGGGLEIIPGRYLAPFKANPKN